MNTRPLYIGFSTGYGNTNWDGLVDPDAVNDGSDGSTPSGIQRRYRLGVFGGVEFSPYFALQGNFKRYPTLSSYLINTTYISPGNRNYIQDTNYSVIGNSWSLF